MADGAIALQSFDFALIAEHLGEQAESAMTDEMTVIVGDDAGTFLTAMLQRVQAKTPFSNRGLTIYQPYQSAATSRVVGWWNLLGFADAV